MKKSQFTDEQIVAALRDAEATTAVAAERKHGVSEQSIHRWRKTYDGMEVSDVRELKCLREEMGKRGIQMATTDPDSPWQNGSNESFNGTFRRECINAEVFASLTEARVMIEQWRCRYNNRRPDSSQHYVTPEMAYFELRKLSRASQTSDQRTGAFQ